MASIKAESTVEMVKCMVCGKGDFTADNPPVTYKGYTDHLKCFQKDFIKQFCKKHPQISQGDMERVEEVFTLPKLNAAWATLVSIGKEDGYSLVLHSDYKTKLEEALVEIFLKYPGAEIRGIFRKGQEIGYKTVMTIHIVEQKDPPMPKPKEEKEPDQDASE